MFVLLVSFEITALRQNIADSFFPIQILIHDFLYRLPRDGIMKLFDNPVHGVAVVHQMPDRTAIRKIFRKI